MPKRSPRTFEARASFALGVACVMAEIVAAVGAWSLRALAGADVAAFCGTSLASSTLLGFFGLRLLVLVGTFAVPLLVILGIARGSSWRSLLPGLLCAALLLMYFGGLRSHALPQMPRHPCMR